jgi:hypothetical protein
MMGMLSMVKTGIDNAKKTARTHVLQEPRQVRIKTISKLFSTRE